MNIGSAKITKAEMQGIPHHLIDICEPWEAFNIARFKEPAEQAVNEIHSRGKIPIIAGGTGFYIQSLIYDVDFKETAVNDTRTKYEELLRNKGEAYLHSLLEERDPEAAAVIHPNNAKRGYGRWNILSRQGQRFPHTMRWSVGRNPLTILHTLY